MLLIIPPPDQMHFMVPLSLQVYTLPYTPDSDGSCRNKTAEYYNPDVNLCCSKCTSGTRRKVVCSSTSDTACEPCPSGQYSGTFNYFPKCFRCPKCSADKGLKYVQKCSSTTKTQCACQTGMYCVLDQHPDCKECASYTYCKPGHGVSVEGTAESDVECASLTHAFMHNTNACKHAHTHRHAHTQQLFGLSVLCLLGKGDCSNVGQAETKQDAIKTWSGSGCSNSLEGLSICPVQSTLPQPSILASTPQPGPQFTSPLASVPLVNVNITVTYPVNIGNELSSRPTSTQIDSPQADPETPLSREEEVYVNMPQRESCKEALTAVQEFGNYV
uniref:Tumor necrosis factor receptor superfamily, member 1B n=1 Tax=Oncorhynchus kisutch TaxID=8019 RepID=A0A8C7JB95_ONCKI